MKAKGFWTVWAAGVLAAGGLMSGVDPLGYAGGRSRDETERQRRNSSAVATMLGEFRTSMSDLMFIKTERYLHGGVGYVPHMAESVMTAEQLSEEVDEHQSELGIPEEGDEGHGPGEDDHAGTPTLIPEAGRDFRGIVGRLHREVKPWRDPAKPHIHSDGRELLPWFRVMTMSDPQYVRGYLAGGFWLQTEGEDLAIAFVEEGLEKNPEAFQLYVSRGFLRIRQHRRLSEGGDEAGARPFLESAREDFGRAAGLALAQRPGDVNEEGEGSGGWGVYHEGDAMAAVNMHVVTTRMLGDGERAKALARQYLETFPDFGPLQKAVE